MKIMKTIVCSCLACGPMLLSGCGSQQGSQQNKTAEITSQSDMTQTGMTQAVPEAYKKAAKQQGTVVRLDYDSLDYARNKAKIQKTAYVYLPCGYDEKDTETRYDIVYLMHDSFPHALEISKKGYNVFACIYCAGYDTGPEDCARAVAFIFEHADELEMDTSDYSLWGGSAGARIADWVGTYGTACYGQKQYPRPAAVIMQYTALSEVTGKEPATYNCVGTRDGIAPYTVMQERIDRIRANGADAMIEVFEGLSHGFGIGTGTVAEGWVDHAVAFWERNMR